MVTALSRNHSFFLPSSSSEKKLSSTQKIALKTLIELSIALSLGAVVSLFNVSVLGTTLIFQQILVQTTANTSFLCLSTLARGHSRQKGADKSFWETIALTIDQLRYTTFSWLTLKNTQTLIHEAGHAMSAMTFYQRANPRIEIEPFKGGSTSFYAFHLSQLGQKMGAKGSNFITTLAGPAFSVSVSSILFGLARKLHSKHPDLSGYLESAAISDMIGHTFYALSATEASAQASPSHDFVILKKMGLHPIAAAATIVAIPFLIATYVKKEEPNG